MNDNIGYNVGLGTDTQTGIESDNYDVEFFKVPSRSAIRTMVRSKKYMKVHSRLLNYLRIKYHMSYRDHHHIARLANEARIWLLKDGHKCDNAIDYAVFASAVQCAFLVSPEELEMRSVIKGQQNHDNMIHLNKTMSGNFGKVARFTGRTENSLLGVVCADMVVKPRSLEV